ncbi:MAG: hypothetical protein U0790_25025 [Isosphaeraceae bacterium]
MNKISMLSPCGAGLVLSLAGPSAHAAPTNQQLAMPEMSSEQFKSLS